MKPPRDGIQAQAGTQTAKLYEVLGNIYGDIQALFLWSRHARKILYEFGFVSHSLDPMCFLFRVVSKLLAFAIVHADDVS